MKEHKFKEYIYMGITAVLVIAACTTFIFVFLKWDSFKDNIKTINQILTPITYGAILAYLLTPIYNWVVSFINLKFEKRMTNKDKRKGLAKGIGTIISLAVLATVIVGLISMIIPQIVNSITGIINTLPANAEKIALWIETLLADNPEVEKAVLDMYNQGIDKVIAWSTTDVLPNMEKIISGVFTGVIGVVNLLMNSLVGVIVMVYLLNIKDQLCAQAKKGIYSIFKLPIANEVIEKFRFVHHVFGGFIVGKLIDSLIIGIICFVCLSIMNMPYVVLISVIIGVTNIIPFFGPFIGAVPSAFLILLVSPVKCFYFLIFILLLQQFDGNILGPKILGNSTGLSSFWVLFSILLFGGIMGPIGMIIGVPTFAVIYNLISEGVAKLLEKRRLSANTDDYRNLKYIDAENRAYIPIKEIASPKEEKDES